ncbi:restriction endonuclease subunit S (plasmid) [Fulvitalea axinellae]|uniref:Restriction endonuclease subunit S n=1 Tax=Fulvitalea axinellae TaxID=1182444 RepID=A0AAU9DEY3_9BACT|nr:restriction endonuclease subunit S [Fulvitalea axinellae]
MTKNINTIPKGYKQTPIGVIPEEWEVVKLGDIADVKGGKRLPKGENLIEKRTTHPYIRVADMKENGIDENNILFVPDHVYPKIKNYTISKGDIYISVAGTLGIVGLISKTLDGANLTENADKITNIKIENDFLLWVLKSELIQSIISKESTSNAQPKLALGRIREFLIPIPSSPEQQKIASILSTADEKLRQIEEQITQTKALKKGLSQKLLTRGIGHTTFKDSKLGEIPESWEVVKLGEICKVNQGLQIPISKRYLENGRNRYVYITNQYINKASDDLEVHYIENPPKNVICEDDDILMTRTGNTGIVVTNQSGAFHNNFFKIDFDRDKLTRMYLYYQLTSDFYQNIIKIKAGLTTIPDLNHGDFYSIHLFLPPFPEQQKIASILGEVDAKLAKLEEKKTAHQQLKKGLMQDLLTGKKRVSA